MSLKSGKYLFQCSFVVVIYHCNMEVKCMYANFLSFFFPIYLTSLSPDCSIEGEANGFLGTYASHLPLQMLIPPSFTSSHEHVLLITFYSLNTSSYSL